MTRNGNRWFRLLLVAAVGAGLAAGRAAAQTTATPAPPARSPDVPFVPTQTELVRSMLDVVKVDSTDVVYDLGCGDGRIVITAVKRYGAKRGVCVDIDPKRIEEARHNADTAGVTERITFTTADLFQTDLAEATVVTLYLLPLINERLRPKLFRELKPGTRVVSNSFDMGTWGADSTISPPSPSGFQRVAYFWIIPADVAGIWRVHAEGAGLKSLDLEQMFQRLNGTARYRGRNVPLTDVQVKGDRLSFQLGNSGELVFEGVVKGDRLSGTFSDGSGAEKEWSAERTKRSPRKELRPS
ncbi:MAG TPA: class I SAM-dependent methyltransferase [Gemmatimonadales bacterium]|nr:class I SAM-dependent methyltransferase [Gemmatimonadales bacterium]